jgi:hypothetical protein
MAMHVQLPSAEAVEPLLQDDVRPGRCAYCDERCNADATWHDYCRVEFEEEQRRVAVRSRQGKRNAALSERD